MSAVKTHHILIGYSCFGVGMLIGPTLAGTVWWILATIIAAIACLGICVLINRKPRKKRLPVRKGSRLVATSRRGKFKVVEK